MTSNRSYLIRALYEWIIDNGKTPYLVVSTADPQVQVPRGYIEEGKIVFDISPEACRGLHLEIDRIVFTATFIGEPMQIYIPPQSVIAIYAKENGEGMLFSDDMLDVIDAPSDTDDDEPKPPRRNKPSLKLVK